MKSFLSNQQKSFIPSSAESTVGKAEGEAAQFEDLRPEALAQHKRMQAIDQSSLMNSQLKRQENFPDGAVQKMEEEMAQGKFVAQKEGDPEEEMAMEGLSQAKFVAQKEGDPEEEMEKAGAAQGKFAIQKEGDPEEEMEKAGAAQGKFVVQKEGDPEEEMEKAGAAQGKFVAQGKFAIQKEGDPEEEMEKAGAAQGKFVAQGKFAIQKEGDPEEEMEKAGSAQAKFNSSAPVQKSPENNTSMPDDVKTKMESSMGADFSGVNIHANSQKAPEVGALAFAQGNDLHFAPGQFKPETTKGQELLGHELAHVVQQREGRVKPTTEVNGMAVNDNPGLEAEADQMGRKAAQHKKK